MLSEIQNNFVFTVKMVKNSEKIGCCSRLVLLCFVTVPNAGLFPVGYIDPADSGSGPPGGPGGPLQVGS